MSRPVQVERIFREVAQRFEIPVAAIIARDSTPPLPEARAIIAFRLRHELVRRPSLPVIGRYLNRHHTSVLAMLRRAAPPEPIEPYDHNAADLSGEWAI